MSAVLSIQTSNESAFRADRDQLIVSTGAERVRSSSSWETRTKRGLDAATKDQPSSAEPTRAYKFISVDKIFFGPPLTARQKEWLLLRVTNCPQKEIAATMGLSGSRISDIRHSVERKLDTSNIPDLRDYARRAGLLDHMR